MPAPGEQEIVMLIEFLCPNGHPVHAPEEYAGRHGKCPQCGAKFQIPTPSKIEKSGAKKTEKGPADGPPPAAKEPQIEFLCPNGHRLHGPTSLQGKPGQCPECGSRFRIPSYDEDVSEEEQVEQQEIGVGGVTGQGSGLDLEQEAATDENAFAVDIEHLGGPPPVPSEAGGEHPWAALLAKLWTQQAPGAVLEVLLSDGEALVPDRFSAAEGGRHAVFAVKNSNGTYTVTAVAWEAITRVLVRGMKTLPEEMFGE